MWGKYNCKADINDQGSDILASICTYTYIKSKDFIAQKAFYIINRSALWGKIIENGINGKILKVIYNMYDSAKSYVKQQSMISGIFAYNVVFICYFF